MKYAHDNAERFAARVSDAMRAGPRRGIEWSYLGLAHGFVGPESALRRAVKSLK